MSRARIRAQERRWRRGDSLVVGAALVLGGAIAWILLSVQGLQNDLRTSNDARDALANQVETLGEKPVAGPPGSRGDAGEPGAAKQGPRGPAGQTGPSGKAAPTVTPKPGPAGPAGAPGDDSTVPGPTGPGGQDATGAPGADGKDGQDGVNGQDGADGSDGSDGQNGQDGSPPSEWTFTDQNGVEYRCTRVDDYDPDDPRYRCTSTNPPSTTPEPSPSPSKQDEPADSSSPLLPLGLLDRRRS